jgi:hypothetical protein
LCPALSTRLETKRLLATTSTSNTKSRIHPVILGRYILDTYSES